MIINEHLYLCLIYITVYINRNLDQTALLETNPPLSIKGDMIRKPRAYLDSRHSAVHGHAAPKTRCLWEFPFAQAQHKSYHVIPWMLKPAILGLDVYRHRLMYSINIGVYIMSIHVQRNCYLNHCSSLQKFIKTMIITRNYHQ